MGSREHSRRYLPFIDSDGARGGATRKVEDCSMCWRLRRDQQLPLLWAFPYYSNLEETVRHPLVPRVLLDTELPYSFLTNFSSPHHLPANYSITWDAGTTGSPKCSTKSIGPKNLQGMDLLVAFEEANKSASSSEDNNNAPGPFATMGIDKSGSWDKVWQRLLYHGWRRQLHGKRLGEFIYFKRGVTESNGEKGVDYFICTADVQWHIVDAGAWSPSSEKKVERMLFGATARKLPVFTSEGVRGLRQFLRESLFVLAS